jgi:hypothetical protein
MPASGAAMATPAKNPDLVNEIAFFQWSAFCRTAKITSFKGLKVFNV